MGFTVMEGFMDKIEIEEIAKKIGLAFQIQDDILDVIGPDEYKEHVDNNAYTNYMAAYNMELALKIIDELPKQINSNNIEKNLIFARIDRNDRSTKRRSKISC